MTRILFAIALLSIGSPALADGAYRPSYPPPITQPNLPFPFNHVPVGGGGNPPHSPPSNPKGH